MSRVAEVVALEGSRDRAAARLGMGRSTLDQALRRHGEAS